MPIPETETYELRTDSAEKLIAELRGEGYIKKARREAIAARLERQTGSPDNVDRSLPSSGGQ